MFGVACGWDTSGYRTYGCARSVVGAASLIQLAAKGPRVRDRAQASELVGIEHRADRLDLPVEYVERKGADDLAAPIANDGAGLAVYLAWLRPT
jgi:hypothetical protein